MSRLHTWFGMSVRFSNGSFVVGDVRAPVSNHSFMAQRSNVVPSAVITGSFMSSHVIGQHRCALGRSSPASARSYLDSASSTASRLRERERRPRAAIISGDPQRIAHRSRQFQKLFLQKNTAWLSWPLRPLCPSRSFLHPHPEMADTAALRAKVAELEAQLAARDAELAALRGTEMCS